MSPRDADSTPFGKDLAVAIRHRDVASIVRLMFERDRPAIRSGYRTEREFWDYKRDCPRPGKASANAWADLAKEVLGFHNARGGVLVFGIHDDYSFCGATPLLDSKLVNDQLRRFLGDRIWVEFHREFIQTDQRYLGIALVPPRGPALARFEADAPLVGTKRLFIKGDSAIRENDSTRLLSKAEADELSLKIASPTLGEAYEVNVPLYRILKREYSTFIERPGPCREVEQALVDPRTAVASITGIGGVGKTALATWAVLRAYERRAFEFIVSLTAKDRELTSTGILALVPQLTSFEALLDNVLYVLGFVEYVPSEIAQKERHVRMLLENSTGLLYVDNLETVDDRRVISFLDNLPIGVRAITTSRRQSVRVAVHPVDVAPFAEDEVAAYIGTLAEQSGLGFIADLSDAERKRIGNACDRVPLAIRWVLMRSASAGEALSMAEEVTRSGRRGEELLEFCFRRVFDALHASDRAVLQVLSLFQKPLSAEAVLVGARLPSYRVLNDSVEALLEDGLIQRRFDPDQNDDCYTLLPIVRAFVYGDIAKERNLERRMRQDLTNWFEAKDVREPNDRVIARSLRQGKGASESPLLDLAVAAERRGDLDDADQLYDQALRRNPASWRAARAYAEFKRHKRLSTKEALSLYEHAAANAPKHGSDRALIFREWGMLLRDSGVADATDLAIEKFEHALTETPNDVVAIHALAHMLSRKGFWRRVIDLLEPLMNHPYEDTRKKTLPLLLTAYERTGEMLKAVELRPIVSQLAEGT